MTTKQSFSSGRVVSIGFLYQIIGTPGLQVLL